MTMRRIFKLLAPSLAVLALAACGDDKAAEAPRETTTAQAPATTAAPPAAPATTPPAPTTTTAAPAAPAAPATTAGATTGSVADPLRPYLAKPLTAGAVALRLDPNGTFTMSETGGDRRVEGRYAVQDGIVTFSDPKGDTGAATFPMRCRVQPAGDGFRLAAVEGSCTTLADQTFKPAG
jgi:hypothetical protein